MVGLGEEVRARLRKASELAAGGAKRRREMWCHDRHFGAVTWRAGDGGGVDCTLAAP